MSDFGTFTVDDFRDGLHYYCTSIATGDRSEWNAWLTRMTDEDVLNDVAMHGHGTGQKDSDVRSPRINK
jgi:hypothetical protein